MLTASPGGSHHHPGLGRALGRGKACHVPGASVSTARPMVLCGKPSRINVTNLVYFLRDALQQFIDLVGGPQNHDATLVRRRGVHHRADPAGRLLHLSVHGCCCTMVSRGGCIVFACLCLCRFNINNPPCRAYSQLCYSFEFPRSRDSNNATSLLCAAASSRVGELFHTAIYLINGGTLCVIERVRDSVA